MVSSGVQTVSGTESNTNRETDRAILNLINDALRGTRPWTRLLSILGFLVTTILIISGFGMILGKNFLPNLADTKTLIFTGAINVAVSIFYLIPSIWLFKYSSAISRFLGGGGANELGKALVFQKSFWKYAGIVILISIFLGIIGVLAAIFIPALLMLNN